VYAVDVGLPTSGLKHPHLDMPVQRAYIDGIMQKHWYYIRDGEVKERTLDNAYTSDASFWYDVTTTIIIVYEEKDLYETYTAASDAAIDYCNSVILKYTHRRDAIIAKRITNEGG